MRTTPLIVATAALALAACGEKTSSTTITTNSETGTVTTTGDALPTAASLKMQPGKWETTITTLETKTSGLPAGMPAGMTPPKPAPQTITACVTPDMATKGPGEMLKNAKVDEIWCLSVNDAFVMGAWGREQGAKGKIRMMADGSGLYSKALGLEMDLMARGLGVRCQRFSMLVQDGVVKTLNIEEPGKFEASSAEKMLEQAQKVTNFIP